MRESGKKRKKELMSAVLTKIGIRPERAPSRPANPEPRDPSGLAFGSRALPSWMYADPADVVERLELQAAAKIERQAKAGRRPEEKGLTPATVRTMRRLRIRELVQEVLKGER